MEVDSKMRDAMAKYIAGNWKSRPSNGFIDPNFAGILTGGSGFKGLKGPKGKPGKTGDPGMPKREYTTETLNYLGVSFSTYIPTDILHFLDDQDKENLPLEVLELIKMVDKAAFEDILKSWKKAYLDKFAEEVFYRGEYTHGE